jgi:hypothetical protein
MGELFVDLFDDTIQIPKPASKDLLMSTLIKIESDFMTYALETQDKEWKSNYANYAKEIGDIKEHLEPYLKT